MGEFDFETFFELAKNDPVAFYAKRSMLLDIESYKSSRSGNAEGLRKTQDAIDLIRASSVSPSLSLYGINQMMISNLCALQAALERFDSIATGT
ncbi:MAG: DUF3135 domain-containing protein [Rhodocyclaceae bacterium]|nr:DUF3135 domain-containing protein [Rhodocyclaceae bacterium]